CLVSSRARLGERCLHAPSYRPPVALHTEACRVAGVGSVLSAHAESRRLPDLRHARAAVARRRSGLTRISILDTRFPRCAHGGRLRLLCVVLKPYERLETGAAAVMAEAFMPDANPHMRVDHPAAAAATHRPSGSNHAEAGETPDG